MTALPVSAGCDWPIDAACFEDDWDALDSDVQARAISLATNTLRRLTGYRVGGCPITVRPCTKGCWAGGLPSYWSLRQIQGGLGGWDGDLWINGCGCASNDCGCTALSQVHLPGPVGRVDSVKVDGATLVEGTDYRVDGTSLVWINSAASKWPACQDLTKPDSAVGTFSVTYLNGYPPDTLAAYAAGVLANEYAKACSTGKCRLPTGVTAVVRQGVSYQVAAGAFPNGVTGIREVDSFIALWNPRQLRQQSKVWTPDLRPPRRVG